MATIVLGAIGTLVGGPLGGAIGSLIGRQLDGKIMGGATREGPRLKELTVSSSSYGQPIARHYGRVRAAGTFIWSTDLKEHREVQGGGKGKPKVANYSYSASFAIALSSRPIDGVGRIWADGNLLRGAAGDLKTGGVLRIHKGHADQACDPLMKAHLGDQCPAHRGCAYAVFEDIQLSDFGNRIPALSFEIFAGNGAEMVGTMITDSGSQAVANAAFPELQGFSHEGGSIAQVVSLVDRLHPVTPIARGGHLSLASADVLVGTPATLPAPARWDEGEFGREDGIGRARRSQGERALSALRYYDVARDYQPGLQRPEGATGNEGFDLEFPGTLAADDARRLARGAAARATVRRDAMAWRLAELDPSLGPGAIVRAPGEPGLWQVSAWEWREGGVELQLLRHYAAPAGTLTSDPGRGWEPPDRLPQPSQLRVFELPWDGLGASDNRQVFAAVSAGSGRWDGAALYRDQAGTLVALGESIRTRAVLGTLIAPLGPSSSTLFEPRATATIQLTDAEAQLTNASLEALSSGANRLLVGGEILQFASASALGSGRWILTGLLRGRGGTEADARTGHLPDTKATLLDDRVLALAPEAIAGMPAPAFAAMGHADLAPALANTESPGRSRKPLSPVHPRLVRLPDGSLDLGWTRRARGGWHWLDEVEQPLVEQSEAYEIGVGTVAAPFAVWPSAGPLQSIPASTVASLTQLYPGAPIWVRQCGSFAKSDPLLLGHLA